MADSPDEHMRVKLIRDFGISLDEVDRITAGMTPADRFKVLSKMMGQTHPGSKTLHRGKSARTTEYKKGGLVKKKGRKKYI